MLASFLSIVKCVLCCMYQFKVFSHHCCKEFHYFTSNFYVLITIQTFFWTLTKSILWFYSGFCFRCFLVVVVYCHNKRNTSTLIFNLKQYFLITCLWSLPNSMTDVIFILRFDEVWFLVSNWFNRKYSLK